MAQYNTLNVKLSNLQRNKTKSGIKKLIKKLSSNLIGDANHETNFLHKLLLTNTQVSKIFKGFSNGSSAKIKLMKTQLPKMVHLWAFDVFSFA